MHWDANKIIQILPFYNIFVEKPEVKKVDNVELLKELPFFDKIETVDKKDVIIQLKASGIVIKEMFKDLLIELKGFKYQITLAALLSKVKNNSETECNSTEYSPVYFTSLTKTVINFDCNLNQSFQEIICRLDSWISNGSGWIVEEIYRQYLNISSYLPLSGSIYIKLPIELRHPMKGLINIQNNDNKCFLWCH